MASIYLSSSAQQQLARISDIQSEPRRTLTPIQGYQNLPLVTLEKSIEPLTDLIEDIEAMAYNAVQQTQELSAIPDGFTVNESASLRLYSMEWKPGSLYTILNRILRSEDRELQEPFFYYLKLFLTALWKLPPTGRIHVQRGIKLDLSEEYPEGKTFTWWGCSSTTQSIKMLESEKFLGKGGIRTLFNIDCSSGKIIKYHSAYTH
ncbi:unnamed protein product [Didymodactylos carnosus]|uniref:Uncharacterized protein n=1 Tax=Didymodactylos carnosus TaxID=1234261 RepID=A0A8S2DIB2_9BILA|nr:unnamed protein product [Didymodactylos carnosus]CAF3739396.1 unnamed protein product [Didymodactylos carnosus]